LTIKLDRNLDETQREGSDLPNHRVATEAHVAARQISHRLVRELGGGAIKVSRGDLEMPLPIDGPVPVTHGSFPSFRASPAGAVVKGDRRHRLNRLPVCNPAAVP
jgi:hypothetical protein